MPEVRRSAGDVVVRPGDTGDPAPREDARDLPLLEPGQLAAHEDGLRQRWHGGGNAGAEDLRPALQSYRSFLRRLLGSPPLHVPRVEESP